MTIYSKQLDFWQGANEVSKRNIRIVHEHCEQVCNTGKNSSAKSIKFRPHHFLCANGFEGKGYSSDFIANFSEIVTQLRSENGDQTEITVTSHTDSICQPCPHRRDQLCTTQAKIEKLDNAHAQVLEIIPGDSLTWGGAKKRIAAHVTLEKFHQMCAPCEWKKMGICEAALKRLKKGKDA